MKEKDLVLGGVVMENELNMLIYENDEVRSDAVKLLIIN